MKTTSPEKEEYPKQETVYFPHVWRRNEVKKMIELTSLLLVAFGSGSLMLAFANYAKKSKRAMETDALWGQIEISWKRWNEVE